VAERETVSLLPACIERYNSEKEISCYRSQTDHAIDQIPEAATGNPNPLKNHPQCDRGKKTEQESYCSQEDFLKQTQQTERCQKEFA